MRSIRFILVLIPVLSAAQNRPDWDWDFRQPISTDFPDKLPFYSDYLPLQNTYYELNTTLNNIRKLVTHKLRMYPKENSGSGKGFEYEIYTNPTHRSPLRVRYNTFIVYGLDVVRSIEIDGDFADVGRLFIYMYKTDFSTNATPANKATKYYKYDYAVFEVSGNGKAAVRITNTKYKNNTAGFIKDFEVKKEKFKIDLVFIKAAEEEKKREYEAFMKNRRIQFTKDSIARKRENEEARTAFEKKEAAKAKTAIQVYYFSKSGGELRFKNQPPAVVEKQIIEKVNGYKKGDYSAYVITTSVLDTITYEIKINRAQR